MDSDSDDFWENDPTLNTDEEDEEEEGVRKPARETDLYDILGVQEDATPDQIKTAYKKMALKHHPDKVPQNLKEEANTKFQQIAFAYAVLSDEKRRKRFDRTGSTAVAVYRDDDFNWEDFYRELFSAAIDENALDQIKKDYQGSEEEAKDVLEAYETHRGDLDKVYESVMLCNVIDDDERFRAIIDTAIAEGKAKEYKKYVEEPEKKRQLRLKRAQKEAKEAEQLGKEIEGKKAGKKKNKGGKKGASTGDMSDLAAIIRQRQATRADAFFEKMDETYDAKTGLFTDGTRPTKKSRKREPPTEEEFYPTSARLGHNNKKKKTKA
ncbi:DnaJ-domain-containing protein [Aspergillus sclerotiicarbonarius CBS 121057]|uniref:DnaJ-domain-containing protein n=1 Tax=Aspergillus sclerotiicarbonarius (strain CBS 121057 / IBT 28362) TaxID=1448318 RepID=A0A319EBW3_ASPSB|nr:DnaJ-domain-containing protein [Aspergillus sclerotiicarbonarius CBS 121057]